MLTGLVLIAGCASTPASLDRGDHREEFLNKLSDDPVACQTYRKEYVLGFQRNVRALAVDDENGKVEARQQLGESQAKLNASGLTEAECSRPYCIIEPLQNGKLDSWCGYRLDADEGEDLYQWLDWETVQAAMQRQQ